MHRHVAHDRQKNIFNQDVPIYRNTAPEREIPSEADYYRYQKLIDLIDGDKWKEHPAAVLAGVSNAYFSLIGNSTLLDKIRHIAKYKAVSSMEETILKNAIGVIVSGEKTRFSQYIGLIDEQAKLNLVISKLTIPNVNMRIRTTTDEFLELSLQIGFGEFMSMLLLIDKINSTR